MWIKERGVAWEGLKGKIVISVKYIIGMVWELTAPKHYVSYFWALN